MLIPFYWLDINKTQKKLSDLSEEGKFLENMNFFIGSFTFSEGEPSKKTYIIRRNRGCGGNAPRKLLSEGWKTVCGNKNNYAAVFDGESDVTPSVTGYRRLISAFKMAALFIMCFTGGVFLGGSAAFLDRMALPPTDEKYIASLGDYLSLVWGLKAIIIAAAFVLSAAAMVVLMRRSKAYDKLGGVESSIDFTIPKENFIYTKEEEKKLKKEKKLIARTRLGWFYSPDRAEKYVEKMELEGWNFYRFDKLGKTFFFIKGAPRKIKFVVDYQNDITDEYLLSNMECGWKLQFKSATKIGGYIIWLREYDGDEEPEFYSDGESMLRRARVIAVTYSAIFLPMIVLCIKMLTLIAAGDMGAFIAVIYVVLTLELAVFWYFSISFYFRTKKKFKGKL